MSTDDRLSGCPQYRISVAQYHQMIEHAILTKNDLVELIRGALIWRAPRSP
jgi:hypothetical protein